MTLRYIITVALQISAKLYMPHRTELDDNDGQHNTKAKKENRKLIHQYHAIISSTILQFILDTKNLFAIVHTGLRTTYA